mgnify:CR=1 FL=1
METRSLKYSKSYRSPENTDVFGGIYVMSVSHDDTLGRIMSNSNGEGTSAQLRVSLAPDQLRGLAASIIAAADFIEENAAQRAVDGLTNTAAV